MRNLFHKNHIVILVIHMFTNQNSTTEQLKTILEKSDLDLALKALKDMFMTINVICIYP